jgi:hypothetical protein
MKALAIAVALFVLMPAAAEAKKKPPTGPPPPPPSTTSTYVKDYANVLNGVQYDLTPEDVQATPDGGSITLAITSAPGNGVGVAWLLKTNAVGAPQWQEEVGCPSTPPGAYSDALSLDQTSDGGYVLAGGTIGCGSGSDCPALSSLQCGLIERLDAAGRLLWARVYNARPAGTVFEEIEQTSDGGFVAVGNTTDPDQTTGALIVKLDGGGSVQWAHELGPTGRSFAYFRSVRQTADGGFIAAGEVDPGVTLSSGLPKIDVLAAKFDPAGNLTWQRGFESSGVEHVETVIETAGGGYAIGGNWTTSFGPGTCCHGGLLLRLTAGGSIDQQVAYSAGVYCFSNGYNTTCYAVGADVYSLHQTADGAFVLAGDTNLLLNDSAPIVPWLARVDSSGAFVWRDDVYQVHPVTGRPLSEYFASSTLTAAGPLAVGFTENLSNGLGELLGAQVDANGAADACSQIHPETTLFTTDPALTELAPALGVSAPLVSVSPSPAQVVATAGQASPSQC